MNSPQALILGITGGIACGKTETGRILSAEGFKVLDSDFLAHELMGKGRSVYAAVVKHFGDAILAEDGEIDRAKLGKKVFADPQVREALNRLVHPAVDQAWRQWLQTMSISPSFPMVNASSGPINVLDPYSTINAGPRPRQPGLSAERS